MYRKSKIVAVTFFGFFLNLAYGDQRAVVIGIDTYNPVGQAASRKEPAPTPPAFNRIAASGNWKATEYPNLRGAVADAKLMKGILESQGFAVVPIYDGDATADKILSTLQKELVDDAKAGDVRVIYYSGHGYVARNRASKEQDHFDQTIVPADHYLNTPDIRDKELARILYASGKKGVVVTMIADSCHSGSLSRGPWNSLGLAKTASKPGPPVEVVDPGELVGGKLIDPKDVGVLFLGASQANEEALETNSEEGKHGAFTWAFRTALIADGLNQRINLVFQEASALLKGSGFAQTPTLEGSPSRLAKGLFGQPANSVDGIVVPVESVENGTIRLRGGVAIGILEGTELKRVNFQGNKEPENVSVNVNRSLGLVYSEAVIVGPIVDVKRGDLFQVVKWVRPQDDLRVFVPGALPFDTLQKAITELGKLQGDPAITWVVDYAQGRPSHVLHWTGDQWELLNHPARGEPVLLGPEIVAAKVKKVLPTGSRLLVILPPPMELLQPLTNANGNRVTVLDSASGAAYWLHGRLGKTGLEYSWIKADAGENSNQKTQRDLTADEAAKQSLPLSTYWIRIAAKEDVQSAAFGLSDKALRIAKIRGWLTLSNPAGTSQDSFPWRLALMDARTKQVVTSGDLTGGQRIKVCLKAPQQEIDRIRQDTDPRWVYVFAIDQDGNGSLIYPIPGHGNGGNQVPHRSGSTSPPELKPFIVLSDTEQEWDFEVSRPYGIDTYILLTTEQPLDPGVFDFEGVQTRGGYKGTSNPLADLVLNVGMRGFQTPVPTKWSIDRVSLRSVEK